MTDMRWKVRGVAIVTGLMLAGHSFAEATNSIHITSFKNGYVTWTNTHPDLYYSVEYKPNLLKTNLAWNGSYRAAQDIKSTNTIITVPVGCFYRVVGSPSPKYLLTTVPATGQTNSFQVGDDGSYQEGADWPEPRFTIQSNINCVLDNFTGLIWARNASMGGLMTWSNAITYCENLSYGGESDWRLPNVRELISLICYRYADNALCNTAGTGQWTDNDPFTGVNRLYNWSSTSNGKLTDQAFYVNMNHGHVQRITKSFEGYAWPVRGGQ